MPVAHNMLESEMIGAIKIKDGLFIGDELASTVSLSLGFINSAFQTKRRFKSNLLIVHSSVYLSDQTPKHCCFLITSRCRYTDAIISLICSDLNWHDNDWVTFPSSQPTQYICVRKLLGSGVCGGEQGHSYNQLRGEVDLESLGADRRRLLDFLLARLG